MSDSTPSPDALTQRPLRWGIIFLLLAATLVNYVDRQTVAVLSPTLKSELHFSNTEYGAIGSVFLLIYSISMWLWGSIFDRIGNRKGFTAALGLWSAAEAGHAAVTGPVSLGLFRGALGAGESGNWPGVTRTIAAWFAGKERALAMGIVNLGAALGSAIAAPFIIVINAYVGWRATFVFTAALGLLWLIAWRSVYPKESIARASRSKAPAWGELLSDRKVWGIILGRFFGDPIWWLYLNWLPLYLVQVRGFTQADIGRYGWIPFAAAALGCILGGSCSSWLIARGLAVNLARKTAILIGTGCMPVGLLVIGAHTTAQVIAAMSVTLFGFQFWVGNVQTIPSDTYPVSAVGSIAGVSGSAAGLGSVILTFSTGWVVDHFSYTPILIAAGLLGPLATLSLFGLVGRIPEAAAAKPAA